MTKENLWSQHAERHFQKFKVGLSSLPRESSEKEVSMQPPLSGAVYTPIETLPLKCLFFKIYQHICIPEGFQLLKVKTKTKTTKHF